MASIYIPALATDVFTEGICGTVAPVDDSDCHVDRPLVAPVLPDCRSLPEETLSQLKAAMDADGSRSCDFTLGGLLLWAPFYGYRLCLDADGLIVMAMRGEDGRGFSFWPPFAADFDAAVDKISQYCRHEGVPLRFTAVTDPMLPRLASLRGATFREVPYLDDYIYHIDALATLSGKKLGKKRNHVNRFMAENPGYRLEPLSEANVGAVREFYGRISGDADSPTAVFDAAMTLNALDVYRRLEMEGAVLATPTHGIVAFTIGERRGDTLHVHVEKMDHHIEGAGETVNKLFAACMLDRYPELRYVNRQDDADDEGLRQAKLSYNPCGMVRKYVVECGRL